MEHYFSNRPKTVCFYSFRGGVGRTTLAVNCALEMGGLLIDFDLEAPGIDEFQCLKPRSADQPGLVEYVRDYLDNGVDAELNGFVYEPKKCSGLRVMRAGRRDHAYQKFVAAQDWERFYKQHDGYLFFENLLVGAKRELDCKTVIIDSRTGFTDIGGVCTGHLADAIVLVFQPNTSHFQGMTQLVESLRQREAREGRRIPRLYVTRTAEEYEHELPESARIVSEGLVKRCEGEHVEISHAGFHTYSEDDPDDPDWLPSDGPSLLYLPNVKRRAFDTPDTFLLDASPSPRLTRDAYLVELLTRWIDSAWKLLEADQNAHQQEEAYKRLTENPLNPQSWGEYLCKLTIQEFDVAISKFPTARKMLKALPREKLKTILPEEHYKALQRWRRPKSR